jgi:glycerophosphoryl diester phosphodiesterase
MKNSLPTLLLALATLLPTHIAHSDSSKPFFSKPIQFGAHRCGVKWRPESTLKTFQEAAETWPDLMIECDARVTKDGVAVLVHDSTVDRTTNGMGKVEDLTLTEIQALDAGFKFTRDKGKTFPYRGQGYQITTVVDALTALPDSHFMIEIKDQEGCAEALVDAIKEAKATDRVIIASFKHEYMNIAYDLAPEIAQCYDRASVMRMLLAMRGRNWDDYTPTDDLLILNFNNLKSYTLEKTDFKKIQAKSIPICVYNIDTEEQMNEVLDLGLESMLTNRPDLLAEVLTKRGLR